MTYVHIKQFGNSELAVKLIMAQSLVAIPLFCFVWGCPHKKEKSGLATHDQTNTSDIYININLPRRNHQILHKISAGTSSSSATLMTRVTHSIYCSPTIKTIKSCDALLFMNGSALQHPMECTQCHRYRASVIL